MSRHRNRNVSYDDLSDEDEEYYGSYPDSYGSPSLEQYIIRRDDKPPLSTQLDKGKKGVDEKLNTCIKKVKELLGDDLYHDDDIVDAIKDANYDVQKAVNFLLEAYDDNEGEDKEFFEMDNEEDDTPHSKPPPKQTPPPSKQQQTPKQSSQPQKQQTQQQQKQQTPKQSPQPQKQQQQQSSSPRNNNNNNSKVVSTPSKGSVNIGSSALSGSGSTSNLKVNSGNNVNVIADQPLLKTASASSLEKKPVQQTTEAKRKELLDLINRDLELKKDNLNLVVIGHVDAGKSTLMGHMLYKLGTVDQRTIHRYQTDAKKIGKSSFAFAWVLDENEEERSRGVTIDVGVNYFETTHRKFTLLDAPGHRDFIPNMITGAAQADAAILVLAATPGEFESGFGTEGQTKEHALLIRSLGVEQLIVAVNKLDLVNWSQERFNEIVNLSKAFLKQLGFKENKIEFIPCSGLSGENLVTVSADIPLNNWYTGHTLEAAIDNLEAPRRSIDTSLRMCISDVFKSTVVSSAAITVAGKIECGFVGVDHSLMRVPGGEIVKVKTIRVRDDNVPYAIAGDNAELAISGIDPAIINTGNFLCSPENPMKAVTRFCAKILTLPSKYPITKGASVLLQYQNVTEDAMISKLISIINKSTGVKTQSLPRLIREGEAAVVEITTFRPVCIELFSDNKQYGRITLRDQGATIASGIVTKIFN